jgi:SAM-dependent methyltransferase
MARALEIGCASGGTMRWLRQTRRIDWATGVEFFPAAAQRARAIFDEVVEADLNAGQPDLATAPFDLILALDVLEHLVDPAQTVRFAKRHLAPDGTMIVSLPNVAHVSVAWPLLVQGRWRYEDYGLLDRTHLRFFTRETAMGLFTDEGLAVTRVETTRRCPQLLARLGLGGARWRWYNDRLCRTLLPDRMTVLQHLLVIRHAEPRSAGGA